MSLPLELVREIIHLLLFFPPLSHSTPDDIGCAVKPTWDTINAFSLTSRSFRALALEAWFRTLYIDSPENLIFLRNSGWFPELGSKWTKHLHCVQSFSETISFWNLSFFLCVSSIRLDWLTLSFFPHETLDTLPFLHLSSTVEHLDLRGWMSDPTMIRNIANTPGLGRLKTVKMMLGTMWCELCHSCRVVKFKYRPTGVVYEGGLGLPIHYARALAPLEYLEEVVIIIHIHDFGRTALGLNADSNADTNPETTPTSNTNLNPNLWSGECDNCMVTMYNDHAFREKWVARKRYVGLAFGDDGDDNDDDVRPPKLRRVEYQFYGG